MELLVLLTLIVALDLAAWFWGADSRKLGRDPRKEGRPVRWI